MLLAAIVLFYTRGVHANPTTVALTLLLLIQWLAASWGLAVAAAASVAATLCFNYFFLPPIGNFSIGDTQNWVALGAFLATALIGSNLAGRLHAARAASDRRGRALELLYDFGQRLLTPGSTAELLRELPFSIASAFRCSQAAVYLVDGDQLHASSINFDLPRELLRQASTTSRPHAGPAPGSLLIPLAVGVRPVGTIYLAGVASAGAAELPADETLEAMSSLVALSLERAAAVERLVHVEADAESERLRATLLDAVTHDLRTPLTSIKAAVTGLLSQTALRADQREELLTIIDEESDRLDRLIAQAVEMAELDARAIRLVPRRTKVALLLEDGLESARRRWPARPIKVTVASELAEAAVDPQLIARVLLHLIENAVKYSAPATPIAITVRPEGRWLAVAVCDQGPGIAHGEQARIFEKFYRSPAKRYTAPGTGMGLAISRAIVEAHGGRLTVESTPGAGSTFAFTIPRA